MSPTADFVIRDALAGLITLLAVSYALFFLVRWLRRSRPGLAIGAPVAAALAVRVLAALGLTVLGLDHLRGSDENAFVAEATRLSEQPFMSGEWVAAIGGDLHQFVFALQLYVLDSPDMALRIAQGAIAVAGLAMLAAAVYELGGPRPALIAGWLIALEPTNIFYAQVLHKEANLLLAVGLVALGAATLWKRGTLISLLPMILGCLVAVATRPYAGWFLIAAAAAVTLHAGIRHQKQRALRALAGLAALAMIGGLGVPIALELSSPESLERLDRRQLYQTERRDDANLVLEPVDFSSREGVIVHLPLRVRDVLVRPYPWELANTKQRFGLLGTLIVLAMLVLLVRGLAQNRGRIMQLAGPLVYIWSLLLVAYSLSAANAGTAFRYRTQIVLVGIALLVVLYQERWRKPLPERQAAAGTTGVDVDTRPSRAGLGPATVGAGRRSRSG